MSENKNMQMRMAMAQAGAQMVGDKILPELGTNPQIATQGASDSGAIDEWKNSVIPPDVFMGLLGLKMVARTDKRDDIDYAVELMIRSLPALSGGRAKTMADIAMSFSGGGQKGKMLKRTGLWGRIKGEPEYRTVEPKESDEE